MKNILLVTLGFVLPISLLAQDAGLPPRPYKAEELKHWSQICEGLSKAIPQTYKGYTIKRDNCGSFEWAEVNNKNQPLTVITKKNEPIGNHPNFSAWYSKNADSADLEAQMIMLPIKDAIKPDGTVDAAKMNAISTLSEKFDQCRTLTIHVSTNVKIDFSKQYFTGTKPVKLDLPVPAFAYLYLFPTGKAVLNEQGEAESGTDAKAFYLDKALIIISTKPPKVVSTPAMGKQSWKEDKIWPQDNAPENIMAPIKNITIEISGAEEDVREMIKQVNWKALQQLLGK